MGLFSIFNREEVLYFPGCLSYLKHKEDFESYKKIFNRLGIKIKVLPNMICCGLPAIEAGYELEARRLARRNFELINVDDNKTIVSSCPHCYKMLNENYKELIPDWNIEIKDIWKMILEKLEKKPRLIKVKAIDSITYHDNCYLGKHSGIYEEPRKILELLGYEIKEMKNNRSESFCSGACGGLTKTNPILSDKIAKELILQAKRVGVNKMVVTSLEDYDLLNKNVEDMDFSILKFSEVLMISLGIKSENHFKTNEKMKDNIVVDDFENILENDDSINIKTDKQRTMEK